MSIALRLGGLGPPGGFTSLDHPMKQTTRQELATTLAELLNEILRSPLSVVGTEELSRRCGYTRSHLTRVFKEMCGESLGLLHRRIRMERAAYALHRGAAVHEAAERGGFHSPEAFARAFRRDYDVTPRAFAASGKSWQLPSPDGLHYNEHYDHSPETAALRVKYETAISRERPFRIAAIRHVGNYGRLCDGWEKVPFLPDRTWVTIYLDNMWTIPDKHLMRAELGYILRDNELPVAPFEVIEVPSQLTVKTTRFMLRKDRNEGWSYLSGIWPDATLSWDEYDQWPIPFDEVGTRACLAFQ